MENYLAQFKRFNFRNESSDPKIQNEIAFKKNKVYLTKDHRIIQVFLYL